MSAELALRIELIRLGRRGVTRSHENVAKKNELQTLLHCFVENYLNDWRVTCEEAARVRKIALFRSVLIPKGIDSV